MLGTPVSKGRDLSLLRAPRALCAGFVDAAEAMSVLPVPRHAQPLILRPSFVSTAANERIMSEAAADEPSGGSALFQRCLVHASCMATPARSDVPRIVAVSDRGCPADLQCCIDTQLTCCLPCVRRQCSNARGVLPVPPEVRAFRRWLTRR